MGLIRSSHLKPISFFLLTVFTIVLSQFFIVPTTATPAIQTLAFITISQQKNEGGLFTIKANGLQRRKLSATLNDGVTSPVWSPNGKQIAFTGNDQQDVYVVNADGSRLRKLFAGEFCKASRFTIAWHSNNSHLAFIRACDPPSLDTSGSNSLYLSDTENIQNTQQIQTWESSYEHQIGIKSNFAFSPDGTQVIFVKDQELYKINTNGSGLTQLNQKSNEDGYQFSWLEWSPDGTHIAQIDFLNDKTPTQQISVFQADGTLKKQWRNDGMNWSTPNLVWSPDGTRVAYYHLETSQNSQVRQNIYEFNLAENTPKNLTQKPGEYNGISWSPDGKELAFTYKDTNGQTKLYTISADGSKRKELAARLAASDISRPIWSSNSQKLAFTAGNLQQNNLYIVNRTGSGLQRLTSKRNVSVYDPTWQP